ncbi:unnamed protein product [Euphydryas editha]|uniref:Uncharacterized protein n=1 Tax=Euphydryas editha TaxID=104508 RepID=A0AAU9UBM3_EUPED|nr:unnamed protein product [Euphydryas editha]
MEHKLTKNDTQELLLDENDLDPEPLSDFEPCDEEDINNSENSTNESFHNIYPLLIQTTHHLTIMSKQRVIKIFQHQQLLITEVKISSNGPKYHSEAPELEVTIL